MAKTQTAPWDYYHSRDESKWLTSACPNCGNWAVGGKCDDCGYKGKLVLLRWADLNAVQRLIQEAQASKMVGKGNRSAGA